VKILELRHVAITEALKDSAIEAIFAEIAAAYVHFKSFCLAANHPSEQLVDVQALRSYLTRYSQYSSLREPSYKTHLSVCVEKAKAIKDDICLALAHDDKKRLRAITHPTINSMRWQVLSLSQIALFRLLASEANVNSVAQASMVSSKAVAKGGPGSAGSAAAPPVESFWASAKAKPSGGAGPAAKLDDVVVIIATALTTTPEVKPDKPAEPTAASAAPQTAAAEDLPLETDDWVLDLEGDEQTSKWLMSQGEVTSFVETLKESHKNEMDVQNSVGLAKLT
jgi:hypothetical protein